MVHCICRMCRDDGRGGMRQPTDTPSGARTRTFPGPAFSACLAASPICFRSGERRSLHRARVCARRISRRVAVGTAIGYDDTARAPAAFRRIVVVRATAESPSSRVASAGFVGPARAPSGEQQFRRRLPCGYKSSAPTARCASEQLRAGRVQSHSSTDSSRHFACGTASPAVTGQLTRIHSSHHRNVSSVIYYRWLTASFHVLPGRDSPLAAAQGGGPCRSFCWESSL